ncbi:MAG: hypothetical protein CVU55_03255 [Deltaproteobacteria bacterium HGW-Deltaproteobacteria-13]|jgi:hypothetical protein|nr:MAG: hypothetical protein CVU55_03255 [Deltaproteobacteria bacterium HGW-Deltaproteobacteria-13]
MKTKRFRLVSICVCLCVLFCFAADLPAFAASGTITGPAGFYGTSLYRLMPGDTHEVVATITNRDSNEMSFYIKFLDGNGTELCRTGTASLLAHGSFAIELTRFLDSQGIPPNTLVSPVIVWSGGRIKITPICLIQEYNNDSSGYLIGRLGFTLYNDAVQ